MLCFYPSFSSKILTPQLPSFRTSIFIITIEPQHSRIGRPWQTAIHRGGPGLLDGAGTPAWFLEASKSLDELGFVACSPEAAWSLCLPWLFPVCGCPFFEGALNTLYNYSHTYMGASQNTRYGSRARAHTRSIPHDPYPDPYPIVQSDPYPAIHTPNHLWYSMTHYYIFALWSCPCPPARWCCCW